MIVSTTGKTVSVKGFSDEIGQAISVPVVDAVLVYDCSVSGESYILLLRNALSIPSMTNHLIPPFMMRLAGVEVDECPKFLAKSPTVNNHSLYIPNDDIRIPLMLEGTISYVPTREATRDELESLPILNLTPNTSTWDPHNAAYRDQEDNMLDYNGNIRPSSTPSYIVSKMSSDLITASHRHIISSVQHRSLDPFLLSRDLDARKSLSVPLPNDVNTATLPINTSGSFGVSVVKNTGAKSDLTADRLAEVFGVSRNIAVNTLRATTRYCPRNISDITLNKRYSNNDRMLRYNRMSSELFMDTMFATRKGGKSLRGFQCCQVFATSFGWTLLILLNKESDSHMAVKCVFKKYGVPPELICDAARTQVWGETKHFCAQTGCDLKMLEKGTPSANRAEAAIKILKHSTKKDLDESNCPMIFWCYCIERRAAVNNHTAKDIFSLQGEVPETIMTGQPSDISVLSEFKWYEWVKYKREDQSFPIGTYRLGRCLGPATNQGNKMSQFVLTEKGQVMPIQMIRKLTPSEMLNPSEVEKRKEFDAYIKQRYGDSITPPKEPIDDIPNDYDWTSHIASDIPEVDDIDDYERYSNAEVLLPQNGEHMRAARVVGLVKDDDGVTIGKSNANPILDSRVYEVMFPDGSIEQYATNLIAENLLGQVDEDGHRYQMLEGISDHRTDGSESHIQGSKTTRGHQLLCNWKDGTESCLPLKDMKETYPMETAEFAINHGINKLPAFNWWIPHTLKKRDRIIAAVRHRMVKKAFKYGHEVPNTVSEAYNLDKKHNNTRWHDAIAKEMKNVRVAFKILEKNENLPPGFEFVPCHMVFDVKMDGTAKARLVATGCRTADPEGSTWAGVVSRETVRLALLYAALNGLDVMTADIMNAYLTAPTSQKLHTKCGPEFGSDAGKRAVITRALYGNKAAGADFRNHLRECMKHLGYESCLADPDLWMRMAKKDDGDSYYEYLLLYVDDALAISERPKEQLMEIDKYFKLKPDSVGPPKIYLGAKLTREVLPNGAKAWSISSSKYIQDSVSNLEKKIAKKGLKLRPGIKAPLSSKYRPEVDISPELEAEDASFYQSLIGSLRWIVEMGRIDICCEVSMMASQVAMPREGHLQQVYHIFGYLKAHHNARIMMDPSYPDVLIEDFKDEDWGKFYKVEKEPVPSNSPKPIGMEFVIRAFVDADHAGDVVSRRSRTGFIVIVNGAPIYWLSKKQPGVETSTFGSEFLAMKHCCEYLRGLRYKIRMMGIPLEHCCFVYGDNKSVLFNTSIPDSTLKRKHHSVAYHFVREGSARDEWRTTYLASKDNCSDICTKSLPHGENRKTKVRRIMYDIYPEE